MTNDPILMGTADKIEEILHLPTPISLIIGLNILAIIIRKSPLKNWTISLIIVILSTLLYPKLSTGENTVFKDTGQWAMHFQGFMLGCVSLAADMFLEKWAIYRKLTKVIARDHKPIKHKKKSK